MRLRSPLVLVLLSLSGSLLAGCLQDDAGSPQTVEDPPAVEMDPSVEGLLEQARTAAETGSTLTIDAKAVYLLGGDPRDGMQTFELELQRSPVVDNLTWVRIGDDTVALPFIEVYEGHVKGQPDNLARLTIASEWARGSVRVDDVSYMFRLNMDGNMPMTREAEARSAPSLPSPGMPIDAPWFAEPSCDLSTEQGLIDALTPKLETFHVGPELGRSGLDQLAVDVLMDGDLQFAEKLGDHAVPMLIAMLVEADEVYDYEMGIRLRVAGVHLHTEAAIGDPMEVDPLEDLAAYWNNGSRLDIERDVVHLVSGQEASYGVANCIGGAGHPEVAYTFSPLNWEEDTEVFHRTAITHELGHIFSAHHHYGNHAEAQEAATIMIQGYTPGQNMVFSTVSRGAIRGWADANVA